jgi:hypothetical protein
VRLRIVIINWLINVLISILKWLSVDSKSNWWFVSITDTLLFKGHFFKSRFPVHLTCGFLNCQLAFRSSVTHIKMRIFMIVSDIHKFLFIFIYIFGCNCNFWVLIFRINVLDTKSTWRSFIYIGCLHIFVKEISYLNLLISWWILNLHQWDSLLSERSCWIINWSLA